VRGGCFRCTHTIVLLVFFPALLFILETWLSPRPLDPRARQPFFCPAFLFPFPAGHDKFPRVTCSRSPLPFDSQSNYAQLDPGAAPPLFFFWHPLTILAVLERQCAPPHGQLSSEVPALSGDSLVVSLTIVPKKRTECTGSECFTSTCGNFVFIVIIKEKPWRFFFFFNSRRLILMLMFPFCPFFFHILCPRALSPCTGTANPSPSFGCGVAHRATAELGLYLMRGTVFSSSAHLSTCFFISPGSPTLSFSLSRSKQRSFLCLGLLSPRVERPFRRSAVPYQIPNNFNFFSKGYPHTRLALHVEVLTGKKTSPFFPWVWSSLDRFSKRTLAPAGGGRRPLFVPLPFAPMNQPTLARPPFFTCKRLLVFPERDS